MTVDRRLLTYAEEHWLDLVAFAAPLCEDPDVAEPTVIAALAQLTDSSQLPAVTADDELARLVRSRLVRVCVGRTGWWTSGRRAGPRGDGLHADVQLMEVIDDADPILVSTDERVRRALRSLPGRQRAAVVLRCRDDLDDEEIAELLGCSAAVAARETSAGLVRLTGALGLHANGAAGGLDPDPTDRTERLVGAALVSPPPPALLAADRPRALERRAQRVRQRRYVAVAVAAVVVLAAVGLGLTQRSDTKTVGAGTAALNRAVKASTSAAARASALAAVSDLPHPFDEGAPAVPVLEPRVLARSPASFATAVTAGGGELWTIEVVATKTGSRSYVVERDPTSNHLVGRQRVSSDADDIGYGGGRVWVWNDNDAAGRTVIESIDSRGDSRSQSFSPSIAIQSAAFTSGRTWLAEPTENAVVSYDQDLNSQVGHHARGAQYAVAVSRHSIVVASGGSIRELPSDRTVDAGQSTGPKGRLTLLASAPSYGLWIGHGTRLAYQAGLGRPVGRALVLPHQVFAVSGGPKDGVFVAMHSENPLNHDPYLVYFSPAALRQVDPRPTYRLDGEVQAESLVADPAGGVVYTTNAGAVVRWDPAG